jgi:uncharacterized protein (TIGR00251 family)
MSFLHPHKNGVLIAIRVQPRGSKNEIGEPVGDELKIKVTAPPVDSAANEALIRLLSDTLDCPKSAIQLLRGQASRHKQVLVTGLSIETVQQRLTAAGKNAH